MDVQEYIREDGSNPYRKWFDSLEEMAAAKVSFARTRLTLGNTSNLKWFGGIGEYKIDWGPGYRIYLVQDGQDLIILFGGGTKKRQQADIQQALRMNEEYQQRKQQARDAEAQAEAAKQTEKTSKNRKKRR
jgi:putative addiction module killer protein